MWVHYRFTGMTVGRLDNMGGSKTLPEPMRKHVHQRFLDLLDAKWPKEPGAKQRSETQGRIGELLVAGSDLDPIKQGQISEIETRGTGIGTTFLLALSHFTGESINELLGPTAPQQQARGDGDATTLETEAAYSAIAFVEVIEQKGFAYGGVAGERYRAMRGATRAVQEKRQLEITEVTSAVIAIDKIRRASDAFARATEQTSRAARTADDAVTKLIKRAG